MARYIPTSQETAHIRRMIGWPWLLPLPRCPGKNMYAVRRLEVLGDFSHSGHASQHVCEVCGCKRIAGDRTWVTGRHGNFWGLGAHLGHYGVGFCYHHELGNRSGMAERFAVNHMRSLQINGQSSSRTDEYLRTVNTSAEVARREQEIVRGIELVTDTLNEFQAVLETGVDRNGKEADEKIGKEAGPMTYKSRVELGLKVAATLAKMLESRRTLESDDYVHIAQIRMRIPQMIAMTFRFLLDAKDRKAWLDLFSKIWSDDGLEIVGYDTAKNITDVECSEAPGNGVESAEGQEIAPEALPGVRGVHVADDGGDGAQG